MRTNLLRRFINLVFPPHADVRAAEYVEETALFDVFMLSRLVGSRVYIALPYRDRNVRVLVRANKFHGDRHAAQLLGAALAEMLMSLAEEYALAAHARSPLLVPVPASPKRLRERGENQVERIIGALPEEVRRYYDIETRALKRRHRESQVRVPYASRHTNVRGAFYVYEARRVSGRSVILVDDVIESGATMKDAMRALREAGAQDVIGVALAK